MKQNPKIIETLVNISYYTMGILAIILVICGISIPVINNLFNTFPYIKNNDLIMISISILVMGLLCVLVCTLFYIKKRNILKNNEFKTYSEDLRKIVISNNDTVSETNIKNNDTIKLDAIERMLINLNEMKKFYTWSQEQTRFSFALAVALSIFGFTIIIFTVLYSLLSKISFEVTLIPTIAGATTEFLAGTALVIYRHSLSQVNHYHEALHEDERFLSSIALLSKFSTIEAQDEMLKEIIRNEINLNTLLISKKENTKIIT